MRLVLAALILLVGAALPAAAQERLALVIGNSAYDASAGGRLDKPTQDADTIAAALREIGFDVTLRKDLGYQALRREIRDHRRRLDAAGPGAINFFYFAGHGANDSEGSFGGTNYLIPIGAQLQSVRDLSVEAIELGDAITAFSRAGVSFVVFDACRNYPFSSTAIRSTTRGFKPEREVKGTFIAFSSEPGSVAFDDSGYAQSLADALRTPGLNHRDVFTRVRSHVYDKTGQEQFAWFRDGVLGDVAFKAGRQPPPGLDEETRLWIDTTRVSNDVDARCEAYRTYLSRFPSGQFSGTAESLMVEYKCDAPSAPPAMFMTSAPPMETIAPTGNGGTSRQPGDVFRDCNDCPEMVVIPAGSFTMGSPPGEAGRENDEGPQRAVQIDYQFAVGKYEVTWAEWEACVADGGCSNSGPNSPGADKGWGKGSRPVINVSWEDAQAYVDWLSRKTGETYRLLSEAEWEYAARAATTSAYSWGGSASHEYANYGLDQCCSGLASGRDRWVNTSPAGSFPDNAFGLYDLHGNVREWVEDCYENSYSGAPTDGSARIVSDCSQRVARGGSWYVIPQYLRSANRYRNNPTFRRSYVGFRVARSLED